MTSLVKRRTYDGEMPPVHCYKEGRVVLEIHAAKNETGMRKLADVQRTALDEYIEKYGLFELYDAELDEYIEKYGLFELYDAELDELGVVVGGRSV